MVIRLRSPIVFQQQDNPGLPTVNPANTRRPMRIEVGAPGQNIVSGILRATDYNTDLQPPMLYDTYDKMRKGDGQIGALMNALKLPILNLDWRVEPGTTDEADKAIADWVYNQLSMMSTSLQELMFNVLLYLDYGSMPFEKVWALTDDNLITIHKIAPRMPKTVQQWNVDEYGGLAGITQLAYRASTIIPVPIPGEKLLVFVNNQEGADWRGNSILRTCYKHWYIKDKLYIIDAIAKERRAIGVDVGTLKGPDVNDDDEEDLTRALMGLHAHEKQFFIEQEERFSYRIEGIAGRPMSTLDSIEYHDKLILRSMLAEFIALGTTGVGSFAMSRDKSSFFTMSLNAIANHIAEVFNRYLIPQWIGFNWRVTKYPKLVHSRIDSRDVAALATAIQTLSQTGFLNPTSSDEVAMRDALELPQVARDHDVNGIPLTGAQMAQIITLFTNVGQGFISMDSARAILQASFPFLSEEQVEAITAKGIDNAIQRP